MSGRGNEAIEDLEPYDPPETAAIAANAALELAHSEAPEADQAAETEALRAAVPTKARQRKTLSGILPFMRTLAASNERASVPMAILDARLSFVHRNARFRALMKAFAYPELPSFLEAFSRSIESTKAAELKSALSDRERGYGWRGEIDHWARDASRVRTMAHIHPFFAPSAPGSRPLAYFVHLDDVTEEKMLDLRQVLKALLKASLLKDKETGWHVQRVNLYSRSMATRMFGNPLFPRVDVEFIEEIGFLAAMHDVGKIGVPDDILNKQGPLFEDEWAQMRQHTINGGILLHSIYPNPMAREIALSHHEWWNGKGYPYNLYEKMIPLAARVVSVCDVYDALRMRRSYKPAFPHAETVDKICKESGKHFDPDLIGVFESMHDEFDAIYRENRDEDDFAEGRDDRDPPIATLRT